MATFVKQWEGSGTKIGGLFGASKNQNDLLLPWNRPMQAAVLLYAGSAMRLSVKKSKAVWAEQLRSFNTSDLFQDDDAAMFGSNSLLATDQGIRGFLSIVNDTLFVSADDLELGQWTWESVYATASAKKLAATEEQAQSAALASFKKTACASFLDDLTVRLAEYDWRTSATPGLTETDRVMKLAFRGSSGYRELRKRLLEHLTKKAGPVSTAAKSVLLSLGY